MFAQFSHKAAQFLKAFGYLTLLSNLLACIILILVIRMLYKMTTKVGFGQPAVNQQRQLSFSVTLIHIALIFGFTVVSILQFIVPSEEKRKVEDERIYSFLTLFGGLSDIFISLMLWFATDEHQQASVYIDPNTNQAYAVLDVIKRPKSSRLSINNHNDESELVERESETGSESVLLSDRLVAQFFAESVYFNNFDTFSSWPEPNDNATSFTE